MIMLVHLLIPHFHHYFLLPSITTLGWYRVVMLRRKSHVCGWSHLSHALTYTFFTKFHVILLALPPYVTITRRFVINHIVRQWTISHCFDYPLFFQAFLFNIYSLSVPPVSAMVPLAKQCAFEEPSVETISGENVLTWPQVVSTFFLQSSCCLMLNVIKSVFREESQHEFKSQLDTRYYYYIIVLTAKLPNWYRHRWVFAKLV